MRDFLVFLIAIALMVGLVIGIDNDNERRHNGGYCQTCGGEVLPVGHQYHTDYYCQACRKYNE